MKAISASLVIYNTDKSLILRVLDCIKQSAVFEQVIIIDNSPTITGYVSFEFPWVTYIHVGKNIGYGAGHNIAINRIIDSSDLHLVINPDIYFNPPSIRQMIARMCEDSSIGQLMPKVIYPDGNLQFLCKLLPTPMDLFVRRFFQGPLKSIVKKKSAQFELRFTGYDVEMDVPFLSGCFMLFRVSALKAVGLFDEKFFMYGEDIDITRRMHARYRTIFYPGAVIVHYHAKESYKSIKMLWVHIVNISRYFMKWGWFYDPERSAINKKVLFALKEKLQR